MKKTIKIKTIVWRNDVDTRFFFKKMPYILNRYNFIETATPDFVIYYYAVKQKNLPKGAIKISIPIENKFPNMETCDWAFSVKYGDQINNERHMRLPTYTRLGAGKDLIKKSDYDPEKIISKKKRFCAFIHWNGSAKFRKEFFYKLSRYKKVDAPGRACNNMPSMSGHTDWNNVKRHVHSRNSHNAYAEKIEFLKQYKFCITFANESSLGYTSEKIYHSMLADCIPIYWGNPLVNRDFNTKSFLNFHDYNSVDRLIEKIIELDNDDDLYMQYLSRPWLPNNRLTPWLKPKAYIKRFDQIFNR